MEDINFKDIHIGKTIKQIVKLKNIEEARICAYMKCDTETLKQMYRQKSIDTKLLLKWCKLLQYNFFRLYVAHLQLYKPVAANTKINIPSNDNSKTYEFKKNIYSPEIKDYIIQQILKKELTVSEIIDKYQIPKVTVYRWLRKKKTNKPVSNTNQDLKKQNIQAIHSQKRTGYLNIYRDFILSQQTIPTEKKLQLLDKVNRVKNFKHIIELNLDIKTILNSPYDIKEYQKLKSYDKAYIMYILEQQTKFNLSDTEIARTFKMSRNTIAKWKKVFGAKTQQ